MATIRSHLSDLRGLIKEHQNDSKYVDSYLYSLLNKAKMQLQTQTVKKFHKLSDWNWFTFCISLEKKKSHNCDCVAVGCDVLKSVEVLPGTVTGMHRDYIKIHTLGGKEIPRMTEQEVISNQWDDIKKDEPGWWIQNQKLVVWNNLDWTAIQVTTVPEDIVAWSTIQLCTSDGTDCGAILDHDFGLDADESLMAYKIVLEILSIPLRIPEDYASDHNPEIRN